MNDNLLNILELEEDLYDSIRTRFESMEYTDAVKSAFIHLTDYLRTVSGLHLDGVELIGKTFGGKDSQIIQLTEMKTETDRNIQEGIQFILRGIYQAFRNPRNHNKYQDDKATAIRIISIIDLMIKFIRNNIKEYNYEEILKRIFDDYFYESDEFADSLVAEIPVDKRYDIFLKVLDMINHGKRDKLAYFFNALYRVFDQKTLTIATEEIGKRTRLIDKNDIIPYLFILRPDMWGKLPKEIRLRLEGMIIDDVSKGEIQNGYTSGIFGTWGTVFAPYFELREELGNAIIERLHQSWYSQNYIARIYLEVLPIIFVSTEEISKACSGIAYAAVVNRARDLRHELIKFIPTLKTEWKVLLKDKVDEKFYHDHNYATTLIEIIDSK